MNGMPAFMAASAEAFDVAGSITDATIALTFLATQSSIELASRAGLFCESMAIVAMPREAPAFSYSFRRVAKYSISVVGTIVQTVSLESWATAGAGSNAEGAVTMARPKAARPRCLERRTAIWWAMVSSL